MNITVFLGEVIGTFLLILLGDGIVANVVLKKTKGNNAGWLAITAGWALAVLIPVYIFGGVSGAHFNPAVTIALAIVGKFAWRQVPMYLLGQFIGAFLGAVAVFVMYYDHFKVTDDSHLKLATFATTPEIPNKVSNFISEFIGTFVLMFGLLGIASGTFAGGVQPLAVGFLILAIGLCLGGTTGYAINPMRDFGPRLAHAILPIPGKGTSNWGYGWIPVVAPVLGAVVAAVMYTFLF
ncbi:MAG: MIP/aquaporin family protein [Sarcina sp.]